MQPVSTAWVAEQEKNFVGESFVEIILDVGDPDAQADASESDNGHEAFSNSGNIVREVEKKPTRYATAEHNIWRLDGSAELLPTSGYGEQGYVGNALSDAEGRYGVTPTITVSFSAAVGSITPGITIVWGEAYEEFADTFRVTVYSGNVTVWQETVTENRDVTSVLMKDATGFDRITVEILKWCLPYRRARIKELVIGIRRTYTKSDLMGYTHEMTVDALSATLPKSEIVFEVKNLNGEYNPDNIEGFTQYLMTRQDITARYGYKLNGSTEWIKAGTFFLSEWDLPQNGITATFTARDALEYMNDVYTGPVSGTLYEIATAAMNQAGLPLMEDGSIRWTIDGLLKNINAPPNVELQEGTTVAEVLQYCANAACCVFYQDRSGLLHIEPLPDGETDYKIDRFVSYADSESNLLKQLKAVNVNNGQYVMPVGTVGETQPISNPLISDAQAPIVSAWAASYLQNRKTLSGQFRADPRLDALDRATVKNKYAENTVLVTTVKYSFNGAFRGDYEGRAGA